MHCFNVEKLKVSKNCYNAERKRPGL